MSKTPLIQELFGAFFRLGLTAFGGPAMVAQIRKMAVGKKEWISDASFRYSADSKWWSWPSSPTRPSRSGKPG
jgi:chromate transport protein ChrA